MQKKVYALAGAALLVSATAGQTAAPKISGKYAFLSSTFCEAQLTLKKDNQGKVTDVLISRSGLLSSNVGYITFTPTSNAAGDAVITGSTMVEGGALRVNNNGFNWTQKTDNVPSTPYSFTATTFTFGDQTYKMVFSEADTTSGFFRQVYLMRRASNDNNTNPDCVEIISANKQPLSE
jgi:hypothetical protein